MAEEAIVKDEMNRDKFFTELLRGLTLDELEQVQDAYWLAKNAHYWDEPRDNGQRYFEHLRTVAIILIERGFRDKDTVTVALLHDILENTNTHPRIIVKQFPNHIIWRSLYALSKKIPFFDPLTGQLHDRMEKEISVYFSRIASSDELVRRVKLADRLHNLRTMQAWTRNRQERYITETETYILPIAENTDRWFLQELKAAIADVKSSWQAQEARG